MKTKIMILWLFLLTTIIYYNIQSYYSVENQRQRYLDNALAENTSINQNLKSALSDKLLNDKCIKENSNTGKVFDCTSLINYTIEDIEITTINANGSATWAVSSSLKVEIKDIDEQDKIIQQKICELWKLNWNVSPLCNNTLLYNNLKKISEDKWVDFQLMLWISYAESHIWANFAPWCSLNTYYNLWWVKARKLDNWLTLKNQPIPDKNWCRLYKFNSIEDYWNSKANSLKFWYINKQCSTPECISKWYVIWNWVIKEWWSKRVNIFYNL